MPPLTSVSRPLQLTEVIQTDATCDSCFVIAVASLSAAKDPCKLAAVLSHEVDRCD